MALYSMYCIIICPFLSRSDRKSMMLFAILRAAVSDPEKNVSSFPADLGPRERKQLEFYNTRYSVCEQVWSWKNKATSQKFRSLLYECIFVGVQCTVVRLLVLWHVFSIWSCLQRNGNNKILEFQLTGKTAVDIFRCTVHCVAPRTRSTVYSKHIVLKNVGANREEIISDSQ